MRYLLKSVLLPSFSNPLEILIDDGKVAAIKESVEASDAIALDLEGKMLTPGFFDLATDMGDPGYESREDIYSGLSAAAAGGFTDVCVLPETEPKLDTKGTVEYLLRKSGNGVTKVHVAANISKKGHGEDMAEMLDLHKAGAAYFTDATPVGNSMLLLKALQYTQRFGGVVSDRPCDVSLAQFGQMHEGEFSTSLGLRGIPKLAEVLAVQRDIEILKYTGGRLHLSGISCAESVDLIQKAKDDGLAISCDVPLFNLLYSDQEIPPFDTNFKVMPPYRGLEDRNRLQKGLLDGTIDAIASFHQPRTPEEKELEFDLADFGVISLQTVFPTLLKLSESIDLTVLMDKFSNGPRSVLGLPTVQLEEGKEAQFSIFDPKEIWKLNELSNKSRSNNSPLFDHGLEGICVGVINGKQSYLPGFDV